MTAITFRAAPPGAVSKSTSTSVGSLVDEDTDSDKPTDLFNVGATAPAPLPDRTVTRAQTLREQVAELEARIAATSATASAHDDIMNADSLGVIARAADVPELEPWLLQHAALSGQRGELNRRLREHPPGAPQLIVTEHKLAQQQLELAELVRAKLLGDPKLLSQVKPDAVALLEDDLHDVQRQLEQLEQTTPTDWAALR